MRVPIAVLILTACAPAPQRVPPPVDWDAFRAPDNRPRRLPEECVALIAADPLRFDTAAALGPELVSADRPEPVARRPQHSVFTVPVSIEGRADTSAILFKDNVSDAWKASVRRAISRSLFRPALVDRCPVPRQIELTFGF